MYLRGPQYLSSPTQYRCNGGPLPLRSYSNISFPCTVSPLNFSKTHGLGETSSQAPLSWDSLESRIQASRLLQAQRSRDASRALRADPPSWEVIILQYASKVLNFALLLHEELAVIPRTSFTNVSTRVCTLCCSADHTLGDTYDHVFCLCPHSQNAWLRMRL